MKATIFYTWCILVLISCGSAEIKSNKLGSRVILDSNNYYINRWCEYYGIDLVDFTDSMPMVELKTYDYRYDIVSDKQDLLKEIFIYSPDSSHCIDLDSYSMSVEKDSRGQLIGKGNEVDQEVALVNIKDKKKIRVLFCGTICWAEEIQWKGNTYFYILGFTTIESKIFPTIWTFELNNHFFQEIRSKDSLKIPKKDYVTEVRLQKIKFN